MVLGSQETLQKFYNGAQHNNESITNNENFSPHFLLANLEKNNACEDLLNIKQKDRYTDEDDGDSDYFLADLKYVDNDSNSKCFDEKEFSAHEEDYEVKDFNLIEQRKDSKDVNTNNCIVPGLQCELEDGCKESTCDKCQKTFSCDKEQFGLFCNDCNKDVEQTSKEKNSKKKRGRPKKYNVKPKPAVNYFCELCGSVFDKRWKLQKHRTRVHVDDKKYVCTFCNKGFKQSYHLREHLTSHTGEKNYMCNYCEKSFQRVSSLRRHIRSHEAAPGQKTKRTPFLCSICGKSFPFSNGVQRHMRIHLGIKNHECTICNRRFTQSTHLHVHMRTHTGEKPYICDTCGEAFSLNAGLQKHINVHKKNALRSNKTDTLNVYLIKNERDL
ncbi:zinc finger protein 664-like isoform X2 [Agrilus planipennis]|nr:zinc finger protein 664-like isoform X2 [Agrilus planipennis]